MKKKKRTITIVKSPLEKRKAELVAETILKRAEEKAKEQQIDTRKIADEHRKEIEKRIDAIFSDLK